MCISPAATRTLRQAEQHTTMYAYVLPHEPLLSAQVNDPTIGVGEEEIVYDFGTLSSSRFSKIGEGQTVIVGSAEGLDDLGRGRVKSISGDSVTGTLTIAWNADIVWRQGVYISVLLLYEVWPKFSRFEQVSDTEARFYIDKDVAYTDENVNPAPYVEAIPIFVGFLRDVGSVTITDTVTVQYPIPYATPPDTTISRTIIDLYGGHTIQNGTSVNSTMTFTRKGHFWLRIAATGNGKTSYTYRLIIILNSENDALHYMLQDRVFLNQNLAGLYEVKLKFIATSIPKRYSPLVLFSTPTYDGQVDTTINAYHHKGGNYELIGNIEFFGYIDSDMIVDDLAKGVVNISLNAVSALAMLKDKYCYGLSLVADPDITGDVDDWWKFPSNRLTAAFALYHLWSRHSTLFEVTNVFLPIYDARITNIVEHFIAGSLVDKAREFLRLSINSRLASSHYGEAVCFPDPNFLSDTARGGLAILTYIRNVDVAGSVTVNTRDKPVVNLAFLDGFYWDGDDATLFLSKWGEVSGNHGLKKLTISKTWPTSQEHINFLTGRYVAKENYYLESIGFTLPGNWYRVLSNANFEWLALDFSTLRFERILKTSLISVRTTYVVADGYCSSNLICEPEFLGRDSLDGDYPYVDPPVEIPDPEEPEEPEVPLGLGPLFALDESQGVFEMYELSNWRSRNAGIASGDLAQAVELSISPFSQTTFYLLCEHAVYISRDSCATWITVTPPAPPNSWMFDDAPTIASGSFVDLTYNKGYAEVYVLFKHSSSSGYGSWVGYTRDNGLSWAWSPLDEPGEAGTPSDPSDPIVTIDLVNFSGIYWSVATVKDRVGDNPRDDYTETITNIVPGDLDVAEGNVPEGRSVKIDSTIVRRNSDGVLVGRLSFADMPIEVINSGIVLRPQVPEQLKGAYFNWSVFSDSFNITATRVRVDYTDGTITRLVPGHSTGFFDPTKTVDVIYIFNFSHDNVHQPHINTYIDRIFFRHVRVVDPPGEGDPAVPPVYIEALSISARGLDGEHVTTTEIVEDKFRLSVYTQAQLLNDDKDSVVRVDVSEPIADKTEVTHIQNLEARYLGRDIFDNPVLFGRFISGTSSYQLAQYTGSVNLILNIQAHILGAILPNEAFIFAFLNNLRFARNSVTLFIGTSISNLSPIQNTTDLLDLAGIYAICFGEDRVTAALEDQLLHLQQIMCSCYHHLTIPVLYL